MHNNLNKRKNNKTIVYTIIFIALLVTATTAIVFSMPNRTVISLHEFHDISKDNINIILQNQVLQDVQHFPIIIEEEVFMPVDFINSQVGPHIYWEPNINLLTITTPLKLIRIEPGNYNYTINFRPSQLNSLVYNIDSMAYLPLDLIHELYDINIIGHNEYLNMVIVEYSQPNKINVQVEKRRSAVRHEPNRRSPIAETVHRGDILRTIEEEINYYEDYDLYRVNLEELGYTRVITQQGNVGYILSNDIVNVAVMEGFTRQPEIPINETRQIDGRVNMTWDLVTNQTANSAPRTRQQHKGLNVLSPTWLNFDLNTYNGDIISIANKEYVQWAHSQGYQVWPLIFDDDDPDVTGRILSDTAKRDHVILQLMDLSYEYNFDGINIDFETIRWQEVNYYLQFLRELSPMMRERDLILSVDVFVPKPWTMFFNRREIARVADYVVIMAYDENTSIDPSGPNASIGFVHQAVVNTLKEVPNHQIILGLPFYTRIWREVEVDGEIVNSVRSVGMQFAYNFFVNNGAEFIWKEEYGSYYGEFTTEEYGELVTYKAWLEDERSIGVKMQLVPKYDLRGVASWSRGLETPGTWEVIYDNLNR